jgi:hypothetical protein
MRQISPEAVGLEIDVSDAPYTWNVYTINEVVISLTCLTRCTSATRRTALPKNCRARLACHSGSVRESRSEQAVL